MPDIKVHKLDNGLTLVGDVQRDVSSAAFSIMVPLGATTDPESLQGSSAILSEMFNKGAGPWDSKELISKFEELGVQRGHSSGIEVSTFSGACLGQNLSAALELYSTVLLEPRFPAEELENVRQLAIQDLKHLEDEPSSKTMMVLSEKFYPEPFGRSHIGNLEGVRSVNINSLNEYYKNFFAPNRAIIGVAGNFDWEEIKTTVEEKYSSSRWQGQTEAVKVGEMSTESIVHHIQKDTAQLQIALAYPSVDVEHPDYYVARVAVGILSGGMAGRLFIEVREKRGLVYTVRASLSPSKERAGVFAYAGTTPENGAETLSVMIKELRGLSEGVSEEELNRSKADIKARLVMQSESTSIRVSQLVSDWWNSKRVRSIDEIKTAIDAVTPEDIIRYSKEYPVSPITLVTMGSKSLELP